MSSIVYCRGDYLAAAEATISMFDRGFLLADAIYEVTAVWAGRMIDNDLHLARLQRSLQALEIPMPMPLAEIEAIQQKLIAANQLQEGVVYLQISRGAAERDFDYPPDLTPTMIGFTQHKSLLDTEKQRRGVRICLMPDNRWARRDIKTTMLLGQVLIKHAAHAQGFDDAWLVEDGLITEGASSSAFIVTAAGELMTRPNSRASLPGCTRAAVLRLCEQHQLQFVQKAFTPEAAKQAREAFLTSASSFVTPVVAIDHTVLGDGTPGPLTRQLQTYYRQAICADSPQ